MANAAKESQQPTNREYFDLDPSYINTEIVKHIGIDLSINSLVVEIYEHLILQTIHLDHFAETTVIPLKKQLGEILNGQKREKLAIINSIITCINRNIDRIKLLLPESSNNNDDSGKKCGDFLVSDTKILVDLASQNQNTDLFFKNQYGEPYVAIRLRQDDNKRLEIMPLKSSKYKYYLARLFRENQNGEIVGKDSINNAINTLTANAIFDGKTIPLHLRVAWGNSQNRCDPGCIYYDMTDDARGIIEISEKVGWRKINGSDANAPILFKRHNQTAQIEPDRNYPSDIFDQFLNLTNVRNKKHRQLVKVYIISLLVPDIDHTILTTYGPKGAAKSFLLKLIKKLVDPSKPVLLTLLKNIPEFIQQVNHNYLSFYDNVKFIPYWLSDEICKAVTGIGHTKRELYTDDDDIIYEHKRCISLSGINVALTEPDALDRSIFIELLDIDDEDRKKEEDLLVDFEMIRPKLLAYILDVLVKAMQIKPRLKLTKLSRMADFTEWGEAISQAIGYKEMSFIEAYNENKNEQNIIAVNENISSSVLVKFYKEYEHKHAENPTSMLNL